MFALLSIGSIWYKCSYSLNRHQAQLPPAATWAIDDTYGFFSSYLILPLLAIAEDRCDYSERGSRQAENSTKSYTLFLQYNTFSRLMFGGLLCVYFATQE